MKAFQIASIVALASITAAQLDNIPSCALSCFVGPLTSDGCASLTDFACHCKQGATLLGKVQPCVEGACNADDKAAAISAVKSTCQAAGVPIEIPDSGAVSSAIAPVVSSAAAVASSAAAEVTSKASSAAAGVTSKASSAAAAASSAVGSAKSSAAAAITSALASATGNTTASAKPTASQFTGGAPQATGAVALIGAAALAMLAL